MIRVQGRRDQDHAGRSHRNAHGRHARSVRGLHRQRHAGNGPGRVQPNRARARPRRLADHDPRERRSSGEHGAHGLRARRAIQPAARSRPAAPHRAHRNGRYGRPAALRRARRRRVDAAVPRQSERQRDRRVVQARRTGTQLARVALQQHRRRSRPAHVRQRLAGRPAQPDLRPAHRRDANDARRDYPRAGGIRASGWPSRPRSTPTHPARRGHHSTSSAKGALRQACSPISSCCPRTSSRPRHRVWHRPA